MNKEQIFRRATVIEEHGDKIFVAPRLELSAVVLYRKALIPIDLNRRDHQR
jgi:hypothetical protein